MMEDPDIMRKRITHSLTRGITSFKVSYLMSAL